MYAITNSGAIGNLYRPRKTVDRICGMSDKAIKKETFETYLSQVEAAVKALEGGKLQLEESIEKYETGIKALRQCYAILDQAEKKIQLLVKEKDGTLSARDFEPSGEEKPAKKKAEA